MSALNTVQSISIDTYTAHQLQYMKRATEHVAFIALYYQLPKREMWLIRYVFDIDKRI